MLILQGANLYWKQISDKKICKAQVAQGGYSCQMHRGTVREVRKFRRRNQAKASTSHIVEPNSIKRMLFEAIFFALPRCVITCDKVLEVCIYHENDTRPSLLLLAFRPLPGGRRTRNRFDRLQNFLDARSNAHLFHVFFRHPTNLLILSRCP